MNESKELIAIVKEEMSLSEYEQFMITTESDNSKLDIHKEFLKKITSQLTSLLSTKTVYERIFDKRIFDSNGDISKVKNIDITLDVLNTLVKSKDKKIHDDAILIKNLYDEIKRRNKSWMRVKAKMNSGSAYEKTIATLLFSIYCTQVQLIIRATSDVTCLIHNPKAPTKTLDKLKDSKENYTNGNIDKAIKYLVDNHVEEEVLAIMVILGLVVAMITLFFGLRVLVYYFYYTRMQLSDYFEQQAQFINMHKSEIKRNSNLTAAEKDAIINAQRKWADRFMDLSDMIADDEIRAVKKAELSVKQTNKELNPRNEIDVPNTGLDFF